MSTTKAPDNPARVTIGPVRFSYCYLNEPRPGKKDGDKQKYEASIIIAKSDTKSIKAVEAAIEAAKARGKAENTWGAGKLPTNLEINYHDGDDKEDQDPAYAKAMYCSARTTRKPQIVNKKMQPIIDADEIYSGMYGYVSLEFYPYKHAEGGKGISCSLGNIMKTKDGERLSGGGATAEQDFADLVVADEDDDLM